MKHMTDIVAEKLWERNNKSLIMKVFRSLGLFVFVIIVGC